MAVDKIAGIACQEHRRTLQVLRRTPAGCRGLGNDELIKGMAAAVRLLFPLRLKLFISIGFSSSPSLFFRPGFHFPNLGRFQ